MSQAKEVVELTNLWISIVAAIIGLIVTVISFFHGSVVVSYTQGATGCSGFLINDPSLEILATTKLNKKEKIYLENKISCYRDQIQKQPKDAVAYTNIGEAERRLNNLVAARKAHQKAIELQPSLQEVQIGLALLEQDMGDGVTANKLIQAALALKHSRIAYLYQGIILHKQNDLKQAQAAWQLADEVDAKAGKSFKTWKLLNLKPKWKFFVRSFSITEQ